MEASFGRQIDAFTWVSKKKGTGVQAMYKHFNFSLKLSWLQEQYSDLSEDTTAAQID
jgi:hypothetical protein